jgi:hypothetical protein
MSNRRHRRAYLVAAAIALLVGGWPSAGASAGEAGPARSAAAFHDSLSAATPTDGRGAVRAADIQTGADPSGDVPYCQGDVVAYGGGYDYSSSASANVVALTVGARCPTDPATNASWVDGMTFAAWSLDVNGDGGEDYWAVISNVGGVGFDVYHTAGSDFTQTCAGQPVYDAAKGYYGGAFLASCIGSPASYRIFSGMSWDENPTGQCTCPIDYAPNSGWGVTVTKGTPAPAPAPAPSPAPAPTTRQGYWMVERNGNVYAFGDAPFKGGVPGGTTDAVDLEPTASGNGYWIVNAAGNVFAFGDAAYAGGGPGLNAGETVTSISRAPSGYWLFTTKGRVISYGGAPAYGDMSATKLNGPVLDSIPTPTGQGYYMVASDGGIFTFGDAAFFGSMGATKLNQPVQALVPDPDGRGYWLVASDGGIFAFESDFYGSMGDTKLNKPVTGMVGFGKGYLMVGEDGGIFTFGEAPFRGSLGDRPPSQPIVSAAVLNQTSA